MHEIPVLLLLALPQSTGIASQESKFRDPPNEANDAVLPEIW